MRIKLGLSFLAIVLGILGFRKYNIPSRQAIDKSTLLSNSENKGVDFGIENNLKNTIEGRISLPKNYKRSSTDPSSFQAFLRSLKLKPEGSIVTYFNGSKKPNNNVYSDVVDLEIGTKDLHQCADAVMRLRAEYLWHQGLFSKIHFNFTNGHKVAYEEWMKGKRIKVNGNKTWWVQSAKPSNSYNNFWAYMELIFMYAGTASLEKEMKPVAVSEANIGDVLIQGGHPGHAVIIVDKAINAENGQAIFLLAQSYMPAQEIQILNNPESHTLSPWFQLNEGTINTPEWTFNSKNLRRFDNQKR